MKNLYNIYIDNEYHLDYLLHIYYIMLRNKIPKKNCEIVLRTADIAIKLNNSISNLKLECETWQRVKNRSLTYVYFILFYSRKGQLLMMD